MEDFHKEIREPLTGQVVHEPRRSRGKVIVAAVLILIVAGSIWAVRSRQAAAARKQASAPKPGSFPIPIVAGVVMKKDVPIYLDGLGTVQAFNSVSVHVRVDGQLQKVAFTEGQQVKAGDFLAQIDPEPFKAQLGQAVAKKHEDDAQFVNAQVQLERDTDLLKQKIVSQQDYDTQKALTVQLEAAVKADQAAIDSANVQLNYTRVISPIDGRTGIRLVDQGNIVHATDQNGLVVITQLHPISVVFTVPEQKVSAIQKEKAVRPLQVLAVDRDNRTVLGKGELAVVDNQIDTTTGTIRMKATFPNEDGQLWPGQFVNTRLLLNVRTNGLVVPASVVQRGQEGPYAFIITEASTVEMRPVKAGQIENGEVLIEEGLQPGERVVVDGQFKLQNGSKVKPAENGTGKGAGMAGKTNTTAGKGKFKKP
jgi:multidrug efflux system membrane fusion protein